MLGPPAARPLDLDLPEAGAEVRHVGERARVRQGIVGQPCRGADPQPIGVPELPVADAGRRHLADIDQERGGAARERLGLPTAARRYRVVRHAGLGRLEGGDHREDHLAVLHRTDVAGRERSAVAVAVHLEDDRTIDEPGAQEVAVQRMRHPLCRHRHSSGAERLAGDLPAVQRPSFARIGLVRRPEKIAVEHFKFEQQREIRHQRLLRRVRSTGCRLGYVRAGSLGARAPLVRQRIGGGRLRPGPIYRTAEHNGPVSSSV